jgi:hypothetical protein
MEWIIVRVSWSLPLILGLWENNVFVSWVPTLLFPLGEQQHQQLPFPLLLVLTTKARSILCLDSIIEYNSSLRHFYRPLSNHNNNNNNNNNRSILNFMRIKFERWYFGFVLKLEISYYRVIITSWKILVCFRGSFFWGRLYIYIYILLWWNNILSFL